MPYENQFGSKTAHSDIIKNPEVAEFLEKCCPLREPSGEVLSEILSQFQMVEDYKNAVLVKNVIASDGSPYISTINEKIPSIKAAYLKFSTILIKLSDFGGLLDNLTDFIDPFRVAELQRNHDALSVVLPLCNLKLPEDVCVRDTFRKQMENFLASESTRFKPQDPSTSLLGTLKELAMLRDDRRKIKIHRCPQEECAKRDIYLDPFQHSHQCPNCNKPLYISDCLRLWEAVDDFHPKQEAVTRFMNYVEHLLLIHYMRFLRDSDPSRLAELALFVDGPLAVFGNAAWLHRSIMFFIDDLYKKQREKGLSEPLIIGIQKGGYVAEYMNLLAHKIKANTIFSLSDNFRYKYLGVTKSTNGFGYETYYGQDFVFKTPTGKLFTFALPYPFPDKNETDFISKKLLLENYSTLSRSLRLITEVETDLYKNAIAPIALAHRHAAISLRPGGRVLDIMGKNSV